MTTLGANKPRAYEGGERTIEERGIPAIADDIIYEGAAVGAVVSTGYGRPLVAGDRFRGFANAKCNNAGGSGAALDVDLVTEGKIQLSITGLVETDKGLPVYAADDDSFSLSPVGGSFIGLVHRFVSSGVGIVVFDVDELVDPNGGLLWEAVSADKTLDIQDNGKGFWVSADAKIITLPATATAVNCRIMNGGAYGTIAVNVSPNSSDKIQGPDIAGTDDHDLINTKATANRGDYLDLTNGDANGPLVAAMRGIWATA